MMDKPSPYGQPMGDVVPPEWYRRGMSPPTPPRPPGQAEMLAYLEQQLRYQYPGIGDDQLKLAAKKMFDDTRRRQGEEFDRRFFPDRAPSQVPASQTDANGDGLDDATGSPMYGTRPKQAAPGNAQPIQPPPQGTPYGSPQGNPYQSQGNSYQAQGNAYQPQGNPYSPPGNPYQAQGNPYQVTQPPAAGYSPLQGLAPPKPTAPQKPNAHWAY